MALKRGQRLGPKKKGEEGRPAERIAAKESRICTWCAGNLQFLKKKKKTTNVGGGGEKVLPQNLGRKKKENSV